MLFDNNEKFVRNSNILANSQDISEHLNTRKTLLSDFSNF